MILNNCQYLGLYLVVKTFIRLLNVYKYLQCLLGCMFHKSVQSTKNCSLYFSGVSIRQPVVHAH